MSGGIFISYRRGDSAGYSGRLFDRLAARFGKDIVFMDVSGSIEVGADFVEEIDRAVGSSRVLVVVIGDEWLSAADDEGRRRIDDPQDYLRREIATALERDIRVIPVLVRGAKMPTDDALPAELQTLSRRQAIEVTDGRWDFDTGRLVAVVEKELGLAPVASEPAQRMGSGKKLAGLAAALTVIVFGVFIALEAQSSSFTTHKLDNIVSRYAESLGNDRGAEDETTALQHFKNGQAFMMWNSGAQNSIYVCREDPGDPRAVGSCMRCSRPSETAPPEAAPEKFRDKGSFLQVWAAYPEVQQELAAPVADEYVVPGHFFRQRAVELRLRPRVSIQSFDNGYVLSPLPTYVSEAGYASADHALVLWREGERTQKSECFEGWRWALE